MRRIVLAAAVALLAACGGGPETRPFTVTNNCAIDLRVKIDGQERGTVRQGGGRETYNVTLGNHTLRVEDVNNANNGQTLNFNVPNNPGATFNCQ